MTTYSKILIRQDTKAGWAAANPILLQGEMGIETDTRRTKIGNGSAHWNSLPYTDEEEKILSALARGTYRGVNLQEKFANEIASYSSVADWLHARCQTNNFEGIHPFDYFYDTTVAQTVDETTIAAGQQRKCVIAAIDPYYSNGDTAMPHHLTIFAGLSPVPVLFNTTNNNNGSSFNANPFKASKLYAVLNGVNNATTNNIGAVGFNATSGCYLNTFSSALRNRMVEQRCFLPKRFAANQTLTDHTGWNWDGRGMLFAPNEIEAYGCLIHSNKPTMTQINPEGFGPYSQWDIFKTAAGRLLFGRIIFWLSSVTGGGTSSACVLAGHGHASCNNTADAGVHAPLCFHIA